MAKGGVRIPILSEFKPEGIDKAIREFNKLETNTQKVGAGLEKAFIPAAAALAGLTIAALDFARAAAEDQASAERLAGALQRTTTATDAQIDSISSYIDKMQLATNIADTDLRDAFGKLAVATGSVTESQDLLNLSADISVATGKDLSTVTDALAKAYNGNMIALQKLDPSLRDAIRSGEDFDAIGKTLAETYGGAAADATQTAEGRIKNLGIRLDEARESIGSMILPIIEKLLPAFESMADFVGENTTAVTVLAGVVGTFAGAIVVANIAMKAHAGLQTILKIANGALGTSFEVSGSKMAKFSGGLAGVGIAVGAAVFVYQDYMRAKNAVKDLTGELVPLLESEAGGFDAVAQKQLGAILAATDNQKAIEALGISSAEYFKFIKGEAVPQLDFLRDAAEKGVNGLYDLGSRFGKDSVQVHNFAIVLNNMRKALENAAGETERLEVVTDETTTAIDVAKESTKQFDDTSRAMASSMAAAESAMASYEDQTRLANDALQQMMDTTLAMFNADLNLEAQIARTEQAVFDYAMALAEGTLQGRELEKAQRDVKTEALRQAEAAVQAAQAQAELAGKTLNASDRQKIMVESLAAVADALDPGDPLRRQLVEYIQQLGLIPSVKETVIRTIRQEIIQQSIVEAQQFSPAAISAASRPAPRQSRNIGGPVFGLMNTSTPIMAHGGEYVLSADVVSAIKRGAPSRGLGRGGAVGGGGGNVINVTVTSADPQAVVEAIRRYNRTNGPAPFRVAP